jgi:hypothetical protein
MLGYDELSRDCYKILLVPEMKILSRKDVIFDVDYLKYSLSDLINALKSKPEYLEFESEDLEVTDDDKLVGDEVPLTREEYYQQADRAGDA